MDGVDGVLAGGEHACGGHLGEEDETSGEGETDGGETGDDSVSWEGVGVGEVGPGGDAVHAGGILEGDGVA